MKVISVIGISGSGKTTTVENLIREFKHRNFSVGSIKDIHYENFSMETPGSNTHRHREAGAELVTGRGLFETNIIFPYQVPLQEILSFYHHDIVIIEGDRDLNVPQILCARNSGDVEELKTPQTLAIAGLITSQGEKHFPSDYPPLFDARKKVRELTDLILEKTPPLLPDFPSECCEACGRSCRELLADILKGKGQASECVLQNSRVKVSIGGKELAMVPFVQEALAGIIKGYLQTLEGFKPHQEIKIEISPDS